MSEKVNSSELSDFGRTDIENEIQEAVDAVLKEPRILTMDKKLIVEGSTPGHFPLSSLPATMRTTLLPRSTTGGALSGRDGMGMITRYIYTIPG